MRTFITLIVVGLVTIYEGKDRLMHALLALGIITYFWHLAGQPPKPRIQWWKNLPR